jgi:hypothetical protein
MSLKFVKKIESLLEGFSCKYSRECKSLDQFISDKVGSSIDFVNYLYKELKSYKPKCYAITANDAFVNGGSHVEHAFIVFKGNVVVEYGTNNKEFVGIRQFPSLLDIFIWYRGYLYIVNDDNELQFMGIKDYRPENGIDAPWLWGCKTERSINDNGIGSSHEAIKTFCFDNHYQHNMNHDMVHTEIERTHLAIIHREPSLYDQRSLFIDFCRMSKDRREESDEISMKYYGRTNIKHYYDIITRSYASFANMPPPECGVSTTYEVMKYHGGFKEYGICFQVSAEDPGFVDYARENDEYPAFAQVLIQTGSGKCVCVGEINISGPAPKTTRDVVEYLYGEHVRPRLTDEIKEKIVRWADDRTYNEDINRRHEYKRTNWTCLQSWWENMHIR